MANLISKAVEHINAQDVRVRDKEAAAFATRSIAPSFNLIQENEALRRTRNNLNTLKNFGAKFDFDKALFIANKLTRSSFE